MNEPSYDRFKSSISSKGTLLVNESQVKNSGDLKGVNIVKIRSDDIAVELGNRLASNMVVLEHLHLLVNLLMRK